MCEPLEREIFVLDSSVVSLNVIPVSFQSQTFWGFLALVQAQRVVVARVEYKPLAPQGEAVYMY